MTPQHVATTDAECLYCPATYYGKNSQEALDIHDDRVHGRSSGLCDYELGWAQMEHRPLPTIADYVAAV
jgi:hypothetical protein